MVILLWNSGLYDQMASLFLKKLNHEVPDFVFALSVFLAMSSRMNLHYCPVSISEYNTPNIMHTSAHTRHCTQTPLQDIS